MKASVIICTYNYGSFIEKAVTSLFNEEDRHFVSEVIIIDDGSMDDTSSKIDILQKQYPLNFSYQLNCGKSVATCRGIKLATGDIIFNLDADDYFLPGKISKTIKLFRKYPNLVHVASPAKIIYDDGKPSETEKIPVAWLNKPINGTTLLQGFFENKLLFGGGSCFAARASVLKSMKWDDAVDMYTDEWLLIETLLQGDSYIMSEPLSVWRVHGGNYSGQTTIKNKLSKQQRLERSSSTILSLLEQGDYPVWLKKQYRLKHEVRKMVWKEERGDKRLADVFRFVSSGIFRDNSFSVLKHYHAFSRVLPTGVLKWLKK